MELILSLALCGLLFYVLKQKKLIKELRRYSLIKGITEYTSETLNITKSIRDVNTLFLLELEEHLSDSTIFLCREESLNVLDSTIDDEAHERNLRKICDYVHPEEADFQDAFENGYIKSIEEKGGVALTYPTAEERHIKSAVCVPLKSTGQVMGYWLIEHTKRLQHSLDMKEISILARHLSMALAAGLNAYNDPLMQIAKRQYVEEYMNELIKDRTPFCTVFADIDHFKKVNDNYGHDVGDEVLKIVSSILKDSVRDKDLIGRYGGEEIIICMPEIDIENAAMRINEIRTKIAQLELSVPEKPPLYLTCSFGLSSTEEMDNINVPSLLKLADQRVYKAKEGGRNRVVIS
ncbi:GGDEF domain-containing protein [Fusibacter sp. JL216-2]|uniref:GGDEF domain-containing protein n=1 Tax=Fusibacter sp. JL216-2 TaxID=3071453 RepID=UPI003D349BD7